MDFDNSLDTISPDVASLTITFGGTGSILIPSGTSSNRPPSGLTGGMLRWVTDVATGGITGSVEVYTDGTNTWKTLQYQSANLDGLSGLSTTGMLARTGSGTFTARTITSGSSARISITNGDGVSGAPTIDLPTTLTLPGQLNWNATNTIASATTTDIGAATSNSVIISGTTTITGLGTIAAGAQRWVKFSGALTLTHNATSLILPGSANITTAANDTAVFISLGSGNWICTEYNRISGKALITDFDGTGNGILVKTGSGSYSAVSIATSSSARLTISNADGTGGNPTLDLATLSDGGSGSFLKITRDSYGRVSGTAAVAAGDITALVDSTYVNTSGDTMTGSLNWSTTVDVASATTCDIGAATSNSVRITGTTTITGLGTIAAGAMRFVKFAGALTLTYNATSLILPGSANIATAANDCAIFVSLGSGNWICVDYSTASGKPIVDLTSSSGLVAKTGTGAYSARTLSVTSTSRLTVSNGDGVSGNPTLDLATVTDSGTGSFKKVTVDSYGRVSGTASVGSSDVTTALGYTPLNVAGGSMTGAIEFASAASVASAATTDLGAQTSNNVTVTGTTTITSLGTVAAGVTRTVKFSGALTLTHNSTSLILPGAANIVTVAGDYGQFLSLGSGNWVCLWFTRVSSGMAPMSPKSITVLDVTSSENIPWFYCPSSFALTEIRSVVKGTSPSVTFSIKYGSDISAAGTEVVTSGITVTNTTTGTSTTSFNNGTIPAGYVWVTTSATSGTVTHLNITIR